MKKLLFLIALLTLCFFSCKNENSDKNELNKTTLTINNLSDYDLLNVEYSSIEFGTINSGKDVTVNVTAGTKYIFFDLNTLSGYIRCRTQPITCIELVNNEILVTNNTIVTQTGFENNDTLKNIFNVFNFATVLIIKNESFTELSNVIWCNYNFENNNIEKSIRIGTSVKNTVVEGMGYIFFRRKSNPIIARTRDLFIVEERTTNTFIFNDDTPIVEANNITNIGNLSSLSQTVVWFDDAEGEMQPYYERRNFSGYYSVENDLFYTANNYPYTFSRYCYSPKNGNKSIAIGGSNNAMLHIKINLNKNAKLSFWYANKYNNDRYSAGIIFSVNDIEVNKWLNDVDWSYYELELESGLNNIIWEKKDGYINLYQSYYGNYHFYFSLDDILIRYLE